jgi:cytosine deaminase
MLRIALEEAHTGLAEGGLPIGAAIFRADGTPTGTLVSRGHNRRIQQSDPSLHGETDAFRNAGRQRSYRDLIMVTTLAPCWYCSGLIRQFGFRTVIIGENWLRELGIHIIDLADPACITMMRDYIAANPTLWHEDIGVD